MQCWVARAHVVVDVAIVHIGSKLKFTFYSITFSGGGSAPILSGAEVWGPQGVLSRDEHFVLPQGRQLRNAAGWVSGLTEVTHPGAPSLQSQKCLSWLS